MDADLMGAPRHRPRFKQNIGLVPFKDLETRLSADPIFVIHYGSMLMPNIDSQWKFCDLLTPSRDSNRDGVIYLFCIMFFKLNIECTMGLGCTRKNNNSARELIDTVNDPDIFIFFFEHFNKIRRVLLPAFGKDGKPGRLIDDNDIFVNVENIFIHIGLPILIVPTYQE